MYRWIPFILLLGCFEPQTALQEVRWTECGTHFGLPLVSETGDAIGVEIILTEQSRYVAPYCDCATEDLGDWNKLTGVSWSESSEKNSVLLGWSYRGEHILAPYIHDDWKGNELNPDFCGLPKIVAKEYEPYLFLSYLSGDTMHYCLVQDEQVLFSGALYNRVDFPCRPAYFNFNHGRVVNAYFGGQCHPPRLLFYRRILSHDEVLYEISQL